AVLADEDRLVAVIEVEHRCVFEIAAAREEPDRANRLRQRLGIVEDGLVLDAREAPIGELARRPDLYELHLVAVFPARVREPPLHVGGPRDQRVSVPEADRLTQPARGVGTKMRPGPFEIE